MTFMADTSGVTPEEMLGLNAPDPISVDSIIHGSNTTLTYRSIDGRRVLVAGSERAVKHHITHVRMGQSA
jgi:hypothetical protein